MLDYKQAPPTNPKLAKTVSSFANTLGGHIIIGVETNDDDQPIAAKGTERKDQQKEQIEQSIKNAVAPSPTFDMKKITNAENEDRTFFIIFVPQSDYAPHMVTYKNKNKYYERVYERGNYTTNELSEERISQLYKQRENSKERFEKKIQDLREELEVVLKEINSKYFCMYAFAIPTSRKKVFDINNENKGKITRILNNYSDISTGLGTFRDGYRLPSTLNIENRLKNLSNSNLPCDNYLISQYGEVGRCLVFFGSKRELDLGGSAAYVREFLKSCYEFGQEFPIYSTVKFKFKWENLENLTGVIPPKNRASLLSSKVWSRDEIVIPSQDHLLTKLIEEDGSEPFAKDVLDQFFRNFGYEQNPYSSEDGEFEFNV